MISQSFDGELIARVVERLGFVAVRGSSSRGGAVGLRGMQMAYEQGRICAFTADGPKGPARVAKAGVVQLAELTGAPWVGTFHAQPQSFWKMKSWGRLHDSEALYDDCVHVAGACRVGADCGAACARQSRGDGGDALMLVKEFAYELPEELIAQQPPAVRGASRMLKLDRATGAWDDRMFAELPSLLQPGDLLVMNDSRVIPARLFATRAGLTTQKSSQTPTGVVEVLLTSRLAGDNEWSTLVKPAKKVAVGETLLFADASGETVLRAEVIGAGEFGERTLRFESAEDFHAVLERIGHLPLPPYIHRGKDEPNTAEDKQRYQTVYSHAETRGSAAAPTAGLHFTPEILEQLRERGVELATLTLHVGLGTFQPVRVESTEEIRLHEEPYTLSAETAAAVVRAKAEGRRIVAVGTTTTRTLEHIARRGEIAAHSGTTGLFLSPGVDFKLVGGLLTNFHLPESTLLMLVSAFAGRENVMAAYGHAVEAGYKFFSYGDCMLVV